MGISTLMTMVKRSGGTTAVIKSLRQHSSKARGAQLAIFTMGIVFFFDPYVSIMVVGKVFGSIIKEFPLSSEKFAFLIDTTAVPVASIFPKSTWLVFAGDLIQREIDKITEVGNKDISFASGYSLASSTISYQFYPCLVLGLAFLQILTGREMGPILKAEKQARLSYITNHMNDEGRVTLKTRSWNWYIPVVVLNSFLWYSFSQVGVDYTGRNPDPAFLATTWMMSVVGTIILTQMIFILQKRNGKIPILDYYLDKRARNRIAYLTDTFPSASSSDSDPYKDANDYRVTTPKDEHKMLTRELAMNSAGKNFLECMEGAPLLSLHEGIACVVHGIATAIPMTLSLIFAWATRSVYISLGVDRIIVSWVLNDSLSTEILPVTFFLAAFLLSLITGSSWCCISILIPATMLPLLDSLGGDSEVLVLILASILSGAAAGDHIGPFSETAILSAIVTGCEVRRHFLTQAPYTLFVLVLSLLVGTLPVSYNGYPDYVGYIIGVAVLILFVIFACSQVERYQSSIPGQIQDQPITQNVHSAMGGKPWKTCDEVSAMSSKFELGSLVEILGGDDESQHPNAELLSMLHSPTQQGMEVVDIQSNLQSFRNKLEKISGEQCDPILGRIKLQKPPRGKKLKHSANDNKKLLIEATVKETEQDGNVFSESLRTFLRTAEQKLGKIMDNNENLEISRSVSADSTGDDSLDHLMQDIASKGWRKGINDLLGDDAEGETSGGEYYTTDWGSSSLQETDDSATATSSSIEGNGQSTYFTDHGDITSCASSATGPSTSDYTIGSSRLMHPLEFNKVRQSLPNGWDDNDFSS
jgi:Na+/H+ antiporter NhaC